MHTGTQLRHFFTTLLLFGELSQPDLLWNDFRHHVCDDLEYRVRAMGIESPGEDLIYDYGLFLLDKILQDSGRSLDEWQSMPLSQEGWAALIVNPLNNLTNQKSTRTSRSCATPLFATPLLSPLTALSNITPIVFSIPIS